MKIAIIVILILLVLGFVYFITGGSFLNRNEPTVSPSPVVSANIPDLIYLEKPDTAGLQAVRSPLVISGKARGFWFFEASFPVRLYDANNKELAVVVAEAQSEWMTEDFVPFKATLNFSKPGTKTGTLVLQKDNPSGLPENEAELRIPVIFDLDSWAGGGGDGKY